MPETLFRSENPYVKSLLAQLALDLPDQDLAISSLIEARQPQYCKPYSVAQIVDSWLNKVDFTYWMAVSSNNVLMKSLLYDYLLSDY